MDAIFWLPRLFEIEVLGFVSLSLSVEALVAPAPAAAVTSADRLKQELQYDPAHQAYKNFVGPLLHQDPLGVVVFDFVAQDY